MVKLLAYAVVVLAVCWAIASHLQGIEDEGMRVRAEQQLEIARANFAAEITEAKQDADSLRYALDRIQPVIRTRVFHRADTVLVPDSVWVHITDTILPRCEQCVARIYALDSLRTQEQRAADHERSILRAQISSLKREKFRDRVGCYAGYGVTGGQDKSVRHGVQVGCGVRVLP